MLAQLHTQTELAGTWHNLSVAEAQVTPAAQGNNQAEQPTVQGTQAQQQPRQVSGQATGAGGPGVSPVAPTKTTGPGVSPVAHRQQQSTHTHTKQVVLITASAVASALALIVASGAIFLINKKKI